jgi:hypothetical protein
MYTQSIGNYKGIEYTLFIHNDLYWFVKGKVWDDANLCYKDMRVCEHLPTRRGIIVSKYADMKVAHVICRYLGFEIVPNNVGVKHRIFRLKKRWIK